jgi:hypothetical protein
LPFWVRAVLLAGAICVLVGAGLGLHPVSETR